MMKSFALSVTLVGIAGSLSVVLSDGKARLAEAPVPLWLTIATGLVMMIGVLVIGNLWDYAFGNIRFRRRRPILDAYMDRLLERDDFQAGRWSHIAEKAD